MVVGAEMAPEYGVEQGGSVVSLHIWRSTGRLGRWDGAGCVREWDGVCWMKGVSRIVEGEMIVAW